MYAISLFLAGLLTATVFLGVLYVLGRGYTFVAKQFGLPHMKRDFAGDYILIGILVIIVPLFVFGCLVPIGAGAMELFSAL